MTFWHFIGILLCFWVMAFLFWYATECHAEQKAHEQAVRERRAARQIKAQMYRANLEASEMEQCYRHLQDMKTERMGDRR